MTTLFKTEKSPFPPQKKENKSTPRKKDIAYARQFSKEQTLANMNTHGVP